MSAQELLVRRSLTTSSSSGGGTPSLLGIAPFLEEDVAFSSIAQNEIGHARALYDLAARELGTTADELAFDRSPDEYRHSRLRRATPCPRRARTIARHVLYEEADAKRIEELKASDHPEVAGLAAKIDREEAYHRMHAEMWRQRLQDEPRFTPRRSKSFGRCSTSAAPTPPDFAELWEEMTMVRRSVAGATW